MHIFLWVREDDFFTGETLNRRAHNLAGSNLKRYYDGFVFHFTKCKFIYGSCVDHLWIIVMFLSAVRTLILTAPIHCRGSTGEQVMQCYIFSNLFRWRNKYIYIFDGLRLSQFPEFFGGVNYSWYVLNYRCMVNENVNSAFCGKQFYEIICACYSLKCCLVPWVSVENKSLLQKLKC